MHDDLKILLRSAGIDPDVSALVNGRTLACYNCPGHDNRELMAEDVVIGSRIMATVYRHRGKAPTIFALVLYPSRSGLGNVCDHLHHMMAR